MSSPNRSTKKRSVAEKGGVDNGTSAKKMREEEESKIPGIKQEETGEVPDMLKQETGEETDALKQETDDEMDALKHETDDEMEEEDDVNSPPLPPLPGASELAEGTLNADSNGDFFQAGEDGDNGFFGGDDSAGRNFDANTSQASDSYNRNGASSGGSCEARRYVGIANPSGNKNIAKWNDRYSELIGYKEDHDDCNVPREYGPNKQLARWVHTQRYQYRLFQKSRMTEERIAKLNEIGFEWHRRPNGKACSGNTLIPNIAKWGYKKGTQTSEPKVSRELASKAKWGYRYSELIEYKEKHGDCNVPAKYEPNKQLGYWVATQRQQYRLWKEGKKSWLTKERIEKLEDVGLKWKGRV